MFFRRIIQLALFSPLVLLFNSPAFASYPNIEGNYSGSATINEFNCDVPPDFPTETVFITVNVSNQSDYFFNVTVSDASVAFSGSGSFGEGPGTISFSFGGTNTEGGNESWTAFAEVNASSMTITEAYGFEEGGLNCDFELVGTATLTRDSAIIDPETGGSNQVVSNTQTVAQFVNLYTTTLTTRIFNSLRGLSLAGFKRFGQNGAIYEDEIGLPSGDGMTLLGVWGGYSYTSIENDFSRTKYDGDRHMFIGGADYSPKENMLMGISLAYEDSDVDTDFNNGQAEADGFTIAPYFGVVLDDTWNVDTSFGYSNIDTDQDRAFGTITSDLDTVRYFASANLNGFTQVDNWLLTGRVGGMHAISKDDSYIESDGTPVDSRTIRLTQLSLGGEAAYAMGDFEPFFGATYNYDLMSDKVELTPGKQPDYDRYDVLLNAGFRYYSKGGPSVTMDYSTRVGRSDYDEDTINLNLRWDF